MEAAATAAVPPYLQHPVFAPHPHCCRRRLRSTITMGIKGLTKLLSEHAPGCTRELTLNSFSQHRIAIDASMSIYQFMVVVGRTGTNVLTNEAGEVTSHLQGMFLRTIRLLEAGIKPLYVFDGEPPDLKKAELHKRFSRRQAAEAVLVALQENGDRNDVEKYSKRTVTKKHNEECLRLLQLMGVPAVQAPSEAEAECAALCKSGKVYGVSSEDMDSLTFGAPRFLRHMMEPASRKIPITEFDIYKVLQYLELTMDQFIDLCILCGCDYCETIKGIGPQTALKLIRKHGNIEHMLENLEDRYQIPDSWPIQEARMIFKNPTVTSPENYPEFKWMPADEEGLMKFLVDENNFNYDRVKKAITKVNNIKADSRQIYGRSHVFPWDEEKR